MAAELDRRCTELQPGDRLPNHTVLMQELQASERTVLRALDQLLQAGRIVRRPKVGTFVADRAAVSGLIGTATKGAGLGTIVVITRLDQAFYSRSIDILFKMAKSVNLSVMFQPVDDHSPLQLPPAASQYAPAGYIVISSALVPLAVDIHASGHRVIAIGEVGFGVLASVPTVHGDSSHGGFVAAEHLINLGHKRIAIAGVNSEIVKTGRWDGHQRAVLEANADACDIVSTIIDKAVTLEWAANPSLAADFFRQPDSPTGLCVWNDHDAICMIEALKAAGLRIPQDISLVGYDNLPEAKTSTPALTTVDTSVTQQLRTALRLLTQETPPPSSHTVVLSPSLVERDSTSAFTG